MKKALVFVALLVLAVQANAYILTLRKSGDTARIIIDKNIDADSVQEMINSSLQLNRAGCYPQFFGKCRTYLDFPVAYATLRVYAGIDRVSVWETVDYRGIRWLNFRAYGYASSKGNSRDAYNYSNSAQHRARFTYINRNQNSKSLTRIRGLTYPIRSTLGYRRSISTNGYSVSIYYNTYRYKRFLIR